MKSDDILKRTSELLGAKAQEKEQMKAQLENERRLLVTSVGQEIAQAIAPALENMVKANQITIDNLRSMLQEITVEIPPMPEVKLPPINVPRPQVTVQAPEVKIPPVNIPAPVVNMPERMSVVMDSVDNKRPLPVMMMGSDGKPMPFSMGAGGQGKADFLTIKDIKTSTGASWFNDEGLRVSGSFSVTASNASTQAIDSSGDPYSQANPLPVTVVSGSTATTGSALVDSSGIQYSGSNPVPVVITSGASATTASALVDSTGVQYSGSNPLTIGGTVLVSDITASIKTSIVDSSGVGYSGSNPLPVNIHVGGTDASTSNPVPVGPPASGYLAVQVTASTATNIIDSTGVAYSGSNPVPVTMVTSAVVSTIAVGAVVSDASDDNSAPVKTGGIARQANPTAVSAGDAVSFTADDLGRQLVRPVQVRDLIVTAYASLTNGTETTLLSASAGYFHDLIYIMGANSSDVAVTVDIRPVTAGNAVMSLVIPASGTAGVSLPVPIPQSGSDTGNNWTADMGDITGTTVYLSALFTKEV